MTPPDLLKETEKAAGERDLISWHEQLTDLGNDLKLSNTKLESEISECANLEERNQVLERDVRRYEERQRIENKVSKKSYNLFFVSKSEASLEHLLKSKAFFDNLFGLLRMIYRISFLNHLSFSQIRSKSLTLEFHTQNITKPRRNMMNQN